MKLYDVFKSECGFRVCLLTSHGGNPVVNKCPWYARKCDAVRRANKERKIAADIDADRNI